MLARVLFSLTVERQILISPPSCLLFHVISAVRIVWSFWLLSGMCAVGLTFKDWRLCSHNGCSSSRKNCSFVRYEEIPVFSFFIYHKLLESIRHRLFCLENYPTRLKFASLDSADIVFNLFRYSKFRFNAAVAYFSLIILDYNFRNAHLFQMICGLGWIIDWSLCYTSLVFFL